jgi:hypothetical protein
MRYMVVKLELIQKIQNTTDAILSRYGESFNEQFKQDFCFAVQQIKNLTL